MRKPAEHFRTACLKCISLFCFYDASSDQESYSRQGFCDREKLFFNPNYKKNEKENFIFRHARYIRDGAGTGSSSMHFYLWSETLHYVSRQLYL